MKLPVFKLPLLLVLSLLCACQSVTRTVSVSVESPVDDTVGPYSVSSGGEIGRAFQLEADRSWPEAAEAYETLAKKSSQPKRSYFYIRTALMLYNSGRYDDIQAFFNSLLQTDIVEQDRFYKQTLLSGSLISTGRVDQGLSMLPSMAQLVDDEYKALALGIRARAVQSNGDLLKSVKLRIRMSDYLQTDAALAHNHVLIWDRLNRISETDLLRNLSESKTMILQGWLELNLIARRAEMLPARLEPGLKRWHQQYGQHPAGIRFTANLLEESKRIYLNPGRIALMLPFSRRHQKLAETIQNGFLYAYYEDNDDDAAILEMIDASDDPETFYLQYQQAIGNGAEVIVGPLNKNIVNHLQQQELKVPTLALNYAEYANQPTPNLYQFGLHPEDEARQIADFAFAENQRRAAILIPDTKWGTRLQTAFTEHFESSGGQVIDSGIYPSKKNDYSAAIKKLLNLAGSNQRHRLIQQTLGKQLQFEPRRRQDIDMIFIVGNPRQARLLKPQLKFHHAQGIPVYATSHITTGNRDVDKDRDLDQIRFVDMPWVLSRHDNSDDQRISKLWPGSFNRLFALGMDAYQLIPSLRRLMLYPEISDDHYTGVLSIDQQGRIHRQLSLVTYEKGLIKTINRPAE